MILGTGVNCKSCKDRWGSVVLLTILLLCLCVSSWGACVSNGQYDVWQNKYCLSSNACHFTNGCYSAAGYTICECDFSCPSSVTFDFTGSSGFDYCTGQNPSLIPSATTCNLTPSNPARCRYNVLCCETQAEADSVYCAQNPTAEGCVEEDVPQNCQDDYSNCMALGGVWEKIGSDASGCASTCNFCNSKQQIKNLNRFNRVCCQVGMAPPQQDAVCVPPPPPSGRGMTISVLIGNDGETSCGSLSTEDGMPIEDNTALYKRFCIDGEEYEEQADTNSTGSSSSGGEGESASSSADAGTNCVGDECLPGIYGVLDTIRDTLIRKLTPDVKGISDCLYSFRLCAQLDSIKINWGEMPKDSSWLKIDTTILKYIKPLMDSSVALDSHQLKVLKSLDTNMLKQMQFDSSWRRLDSAALKNDSTTRRAIVAGDSGIMKRVQGVDTSVMKLDSTVRGVAGGLDTTLKSLDSSLNRGIRDGADGLNDSIRKYLGKVDSSIGAVGGEGTPLGDSLGKLIGILGGDTGSVGSGLYGDSASAYGDSIRKWIRDGDGQWDSAFRATEGEWGVDSIDDQFDSSFSYGMCHGDDCPPCTDSDCLGKITPAILKYGDSIAAQLGDSLIKNVKAQEDSLPTMWDSAMVKLREVSFFTTFDSTFLANIGAKIPNTNTCPEDCFRQDVNGRYAYVAYNMTLDWKLCRPIAPGVLNGLNAFDILKLLARVLTVVTCLFILMWEVSSRRGGGMGL